MRDQLPCDPRLPGGMRESDLEPREPRERRREMPLDLAWVIVFGTLRAETVPVEREDVEAF